MRVVHVAPTPFGAGGLLGGGERYPLELARALVRHVDVELVTFGARPGVAREPDGLLVRTLRSIGRLHGHPVHPLAPGLPVALAGADVVHTHQTRSMPSRVAAVSGRAMGRTLVTTDHGLGGGGWLGVLPALFDRHLAVSYYSGATLGLGPDRVRVIHGGVDVDRYRPDRAVRRRGVLFVGRLTPHKGVDRLLQALPPGATLTVVGSGGHDPQPPERDYPALLHRLAAGRDVRFAGPVPDASLPAVHAGAAVFAFPSVHTTCYGRRIEISELLGLAVLEAMASGTPVVASRIGGVPELVRHGETGFLVEPGDVAELGTRLDELLGDAALAARMGRAGREVAASELTWEHCARRCLAAYEELRADPDGAAR